ncbi:MAG: DUF3857 domain-containing protein [Planctomycetota bacterium]
MISSTRVFGLSLLFVLCLFVFQLPECLATDSTSQMPWEGDFFEASAETILAAVEELPVVDPDVNEFLVWDERIRVFDDHRRQTTIRRAYRITSRDEIEFRGSIEAVWTPWLEKKPKIRARVITRDGKVHELDQATVTKSSGKNVRDRIYMDDMMLSAPLPAVDVGAVVELEVTTEEYQPFCPIGVIGNVVWKRISNCRHLYSEIRADRSLDLKLFCVGDKVPLNVVEEGDDQVWRLSQDDPERVDAIWSYLPKDEPIIAYVVYCTGASWQDIATHYHNIVEEQIKDSDLTEVTKLIQVDEEDRRQIIENACRYVFDSIRYTGLEFGMGAIKPANPLATLLRRYGDCKDQASLMVALLREFEIEAHVALLNASSHMDVAAKAPGLNAFDHAIVYIPSQGELEEMWIDMTSPLTTFGELPEMDQQRLALIASPTTKGLKRTPGSTSRDNRQVQTFTYHLASSGSSQVVIESRSKGAMANRMRAVYASGEPDQLLQKMKEGNHTRYGMSKVNRFDVGDPRDITVSEYVIEQDFMANNVAYTDEGRMEVELQPGAGFSYLPYSFVGPEYAAPTDVDAETPERKFPYSIDRFAFTTAYRLIPPEGFVAELLPDESSIRVGDLRVDIDCSVKQDGSVEISVSLETGDGVVTTAQCEEFREAFLAMTGNLSPTEWYLPVQFYYSPSRIFDEGREVEGIQQMVEIARSNPDRLFDRGELSSALLRVGLGEEAREIARDMVEYAPESTLAHWQMAWSHMHDLAGNVLAYGMDRPTALSSLRRLIELEEDNLTAKYNVAMLLEYGDSGERYENEEGLREAAQKYKEVLRSAQFAPALINYGVVLQHLGDVAELRRLSQQYPDDINTVIRLAIAELEQNGVEAASRVIARGAARHDKNVLQINLLTNARSRRQYDLIREFLRKNPDISGLANSVQLVKRYEEVELDSSDPASVVQAMLGQYLRTGPNVEEIRKYFSNAANDEIFRREVESLPPFLSRIRDVVLKNYGRSKCAQDFVSLYEFNAEGDEETGYVVTATPRGGSQIPPLRRLVIRDGDEYRIVAAGRYFSEFGRKALELIDSGNPKAAQFWINEVFRTERHLVGFFNPFSASPFAQTWSGAVASEEKTTRLAALLLFARRLDALDEVDELEKIRDEYTKVQQLQIDRARLLLLRDNGRFEEARELAIEILDEYPAFPDTLSAKVEAEISLGMMEQAELTLQQLASKDSFRGNEYRRRILFVKGGDDAVYEHDLEIARKPSANPVLIHHACWRSLFVDKSADVLELAQIVVDRSGESERSATLHTLACVAADAGKLTLASTALNGTVKARNGLHDPIDLLVKGRIAEHCRLSKAAKRYYQIASVSSTDESPDANCQILAKRWLKRLETDQQN